MPLHTNQTLFFFSCHNIPFHKKKILSIGLILLIIMAMITTLSFPAHAIDYQDIEVTDTNSLYRETSKRQNHTVKNNTNVIINIQNGHETCAAPGWPSTQLYFGKPEIFNKIQSHEMWFCVSNPYKAVVVDIKAYGNKNGNANVELLDDQFNVIDDNSASFSFTGTRKITKTYDNPYLHVGFYYLRIYNLTQNYKSVTIEIIKGRR